MDGNNDNRDGKGGSMRLSADADADDGDDRDGNGGYQISAPCAPVSRQLSEESHYCYTSVSISQ